MSTPKSFDNASLANSAPSASPLFIRFLISVAGSGYIRPASGTWGSIATAFIAYLVTLCCGVATIQWAFLALALLSIFIGLWATDVYLRQQDLHDPSEVVIDEAAGIFVCLACIPAELFVEQSFFVVILSFLMFRLMDICKPWPVSSLEALPGTWGVMFDDICAGLLAALVVLAVL